MRQATQDLIVQMIEYFERVDRGTSEVHHAVLTDLLPPRGPTDRSTLKERAEEFAAKHGLTVVEAGPRWRFLK